MMKAEEPSPPPSLTGLMPHFYKSIAPGRSRGRRYVRLQTDGERRRRQRTLRLGGPRLRRLRFRRPRVKVLLRLFSPLRLLRRLRDGYVNMMLSLASKGNMSAAVGAAAGFYIPTSGSMALAAADAARRSRKEDEILACIDYLRRTSPLER